MFLEEEYERPRTPIKPSSYCEGLLLPAVSEVSLLFQDDLPVTQSDIKLGVEDDNIGFSDFRNTSVERNHFKSGIEFQTFNAWRINQKNYQNNSLECSFEGPRNPIKRLETPELPKPLKMTERSLDITNHYEDLSKFKRSNRSNYEDMTKCKNSNTSTDFYEEKEYQKCEKQNKDTNKCNCEKNDNKLLNSIEILSNLISIQKQEISQLMVERDKLKKELSEKKCMKEHVKYKTKVNISTQYDDSMEKKQLVSTGAMTLSFNEIKNNWLKEFQETHKCNLEKPVVKNQCTQTENIMVDMMSESIPLIKAQDYNPDIYDQALRQVEQRLEESENDDADVDCVRDKRTKEILCKCDSERNIRQPFHKILEDNSLVPPCDTIYTTAMRQVQRQLETCEGLQQNEPVWMLKRNQFSEQILTGPPCDYRLRNREEASRDENEISAIMKNLETRYLHRPTNMQGIKQAQNLTVYNVTNMSMSISTLQYLEKHKVLPKPQNQQCIQSPRHLLQNKSKNFFDNCLYQDKD